MQDDSPALGCPSTLRHLSRRSIAEVLKTGLDRQLGCTGSSVHHRQQAAAGQAATCSQEPANPGYRQLHVPVQGLGP